MSTLTERFLDPLFKPVDAASLIFFRVGFGIIMLVEAWRFWDHGWIARYFIEPDFLFKYYGFEWVEPWLGSGMYWHFVILAALAFLITIGFFYRLATVVFFLAFSYVFLLDQARYLNHFYLVILIAFLMMLVPANRAWAVDARLRPGIRSDTVPGWAIWLFRLQFEVVYIYAGIVKINEDWLRLEPLGMWFAKRTDFPYIGHLFTEDWVVAIAAYGVIAIHIIGAPLLLFRRTRPYAMVAYVAFHLMNHFMFRIGIFPWLAIAGTLLFLEPDWPRRLLHRAGHWLGRLVSSAKGRGVSRASAQGIAAAPKDAAESGDTPSRGERTLVLTFIGIWLAFQILFPLRHLLYPGYVSWTEEGHNFSWQMKLRDKKAVAYFAVRDPVANRIWQIVPAAYLRPHQVGKMIKRPDMILQFAHHLADIAAEQLGIDGVEVRAWVCVSLNGRKEALLIDPNRDLTKVQRSLRKADWILPLEHPPARPPARRSRRGLQC